MSHSNQQFKRKTFDFSSWFFTVLTGAATYLIVSILAVILLNVLISGLPRFSWRFLTGGTERDMFSVANAGVWPMIVGTSIRVFVMTLMVVPVGVITAIYLTEYASSISFLTRVIRGAVNNLAGVPSIVFGLFGLGFFISYVGKGLDHVFYAGGESHWGKPAVIWAALTLAVMTLPVVIVATEESLRSIQPGLREASLALGATKLQTIFKIVVPQAMPGILTGAILAIGRAAGEVAPILFTGVAYYMADLPHSLNDLFMDLGFHTFILASQSPNIEQTKPILYSTVLTLLLLTFGLNFIAVLVRGRMRAARRSVH
ncbi:MAG: Phosphate transport system permease protein PstA [Verrucomicrobiales bacterium]|nr:Phosphate transport system permease protein PstA [Verrucomicrobiales bacterium]